MSCLHPLVRLFAYYAWVQGQVGPVISAASRDHIVECINKAVMVDGDELLVDGRDWAKREPGTWVGPTVILKRKKEPEEELFGPVLIVVKVRLKEPPPRKNKHSGFLESCWVCGMPRPSCTGYTQLTRIPLQGDDVLIIRGILDSHNNAVSPIRNIQQVVMSGSHACSGAVRCSGCSHHHGRSLDEA